MASETSPPPPSPAAAATASAAAADVANGDTTGTAAVWYFQSATDGTLTGPLSVEQIKHLYVENTIDGLTSVWRQGMSSWIPIAECEEIKPHLAQEDDEGELDEALLTTLVQKKKGQGPLITPPVAANTGARRVPLTEVDASQKYTDPEGESYVLDPADKTWRTFKEYEALYELQQLADEAGQITAAAAGGAQTNDNTATNNNTAPSTDAPQDTSAAAAATAAAKKATAASYSVADMTMPEAADEREEGEGEGGSEEGAESDDKKDKEGEPHDPEKEARKAKKRAYQERKKLKKQQGLWLKAKSNPNVYVSGLPEDVTMEELEETFKKAGVFKLDPDTSLPKIKIYHDDAGRAKGDALISYVKEESVGLAVKYLHESYLRPDCVICVKQAEFEPPPTEAAPPPEMQLKKRRIDRSKFMAVKNEQNRLLGWSDDTDDGSGRRIVLLKHMFSYQEAEEEDSAFYNELKEEVGEECSKWGPVDKVTPIERHPHGLVAVKFSNNEAAEAAIDALNGRNFAGRTIEAFFFDGKSDLKAHCLPPKSESQRAQQPAPTPPLFPQSAAAKAKQKPSRPRRGPPHELDHIGDSVVRNNGGAPVSPLAFLPEVPLFEEDEAKTEEMKAKEASDRQEELEAAPAPPPEGQPQPAAGQEERPKDWQEWLEDQSSDEDLKIEAEGEEGEDDTMDQE
ncbi:unnamed protein product [Vitrella brassicaformis CCMP3155]|uniref:RRM domain-containing protein n=2 Tax=Vitrella brassicaformis TaxID=1169539 RepID=A0A0G4FAT5_VITBC|nr:unnamed protein product [Vitrella brassicaformis CCMP3155]|eukprot:CEM09729.1 unnamed protein product [Vitrella brassicaformis CCMP3155]